MVTRIRAHFVGDTRRRRSFPAQDYIRSATAAAARRARALETGNVSGRCFLSTALVLLFIPANYNGILVFFSQRIRRAPSIDFRKFI